jgi:sigma-B regulation protein RsbU (phosphoserine phosphatase)
MLTKLLKSLLQEYHTSRMARFAAWVLAYGGALWLTERLMRSSGGAPGLLWFVFWVALVVAAAYYFVRFVRFIRERVLWRLRSRLIVTYLFIALVPIILIFVLIAIGAFILNGQLAAYLLASKLREHFAELEQVNRVVLHEARLKSESSRQTALDQIKKFYLSQLVEHAASYPHLEITVRLGPQAQAFLLNGKPLQNPVTVPSWLQREEFAGIVMDNGQVALRSVDRTQTAGGELILILSQPFTPELLDQVGEGIGPVGVVTTAPLDRTGKIGSTGLTVKTPQGTYLQSASVHSKSVRLPDPVSWFDFTVFGASTLDPVYWGGEKEERLEQPVFVYGSSRIIALNRRLLATLGDYSRVYVFAFKVVAVFFLIIEGFAMFIGYRLTRSMTQTVDRLYDATERVKKGDFSYRISIPSHDQLGALCEAFDNMTASVEGLLRESQEKLRLESELEIAREVQTRLFPLEAPELPGLKLYGACKAARSVSGDYYDFLRLGENRIAMVLGDVSGKGISAALLMAAIQSALRAQFYDGFAQCSSQPGSVSTGDVVARLNRQLVENTPVEKYVTMFFAQYDAGTRKLTYTNAGHLPPLVFRRNQLVRLETGGTVVGLFASMPYEQGEIQLEPGDLLLAFTDGITEPENTYGEEFGEVRVVEAVRRAIHASPEALVEEIYRSVNDWTGSPELQDDMTLLVAKATG